MAAKTAIFAAALTRFVGLANDELQNQPVLIEVPDSMANGDTVSFTYDANGDLALPPHEVKVLTHTGGDLTNGADGNWNVNNGDTIVFGVDEKGYNYTLTPSQMKAGRQALTHALAGVTNGAATPAQVAASINADKGINSYIYAVASLTANRVTLFPKKPYVVFNVTGGTAQTTIQFPGGDADWSKRIYSSTTGVVPGGTGWSWTYNASTRTLTVTNQTGSGSARNVVLVRR